MVSEQEMKEMADRELAERNARIEKRKLNKELEGKVLLDYGEAGVYIESSQ